MPRWDYESDAERFWSKVHKTAGCWEWTAAKDARGYGQFWVRGALYPWKAQRVAWMMMHGCIPDGLFVLHACDNPGCVRPDHLFLGTHADNMRDMSAKGRVSGYNRNPRIGESNTKAKLTAADVREIRHLYAVGYVTQKQLARKYGVNQTAISKIIRHEKWAHIPEGYDANND